MSLPLLFTLLLAAAQDPGWREPSEVHRVDGMIDIYGPSEIFRTRNGHVGVVITAQDGNDAVSWLRVSQGDQGPWTEPTLPAPWGRLLQVQGDEVDVLTCDPQGRIRLRLAWENGRPREVWRKKFSPPPDGRRLAQVLADGDTLLALLSDKDDFRRLSVARSTDGGASWSESTSLGRSVHRGSPRVSTDLLRTETGVHAVVLDEAGGVHHHSTQDGGGTWAKKDLRPFLPADLGSADSIVGLALGGTLHLVMTFWEKKAREHVIHVASRDEGRTWEKARKILTGPIGGDLAPFYGLRGSGEVLAFTATDHQRARLLVSRDGGRAWKESDVRAGLRYGAGLAATWVDPEGTLRCALTVDLRSRTGLPLRSFVLLRAWDQPVAPPAPLEGEAREAALRLIRRLGDDDPTVRAEAFAALRKLGGAAHPLLREEADRTDDAETKGSLKRLLPQPLREEWWAGSPK
jgi:hypothetical protein